MNMVKRIIYEVMIPDIAMAGPNDPPLGTVIGRGVIFPAVNCPRVEHGDRSSIEYCALCDSCKEIQFRYIECEYQLSQQEKDEWGRRKKDITIEKPVQQSITKNVFTLHNNKSEIVFDENYFTNIHKYTPDFQEGWAQEIINIFDGLNESVLDIGCGNGFLMKHLLAHGKNVVGIDISDYAVAHPMAGCEGRIFKGSVLDIPYEDKSFDVAIAFSLLEHLPEKDAVQALKEIKRVSKKAFLLIAMLMYEGHKEQLEMEDPTHINIKPFNWWVVKFKEVGLKIVKYDNRMSMIVVPVED